MGVETLRLLIDLLEVKSGDWKTPSHISNKIGRFVPENIVTLGKPIESLFKESKYRSIFSLVPAL